MMKVLLLVAALVSVSSAYGTWYLKNCEHGAYDMGGRTYYGYVGLYEKDGVYVTYFSGGKYCPYSMRD
jgi:hypothetical protein